MRTTLAKYPLTPLNHETTRRYLACVHGSGHRFSGNIAWRDLGGQGIRYVPLAVCDVCEVPVGGRVLMWNRSSMRVVA